PVRGCCRQRFHRGEDNPLGGSRSEIQYPIAICGPLSNGCLAKGQRTAETTCNEYKSRYLHHFNVLMFSSLLFITAALDTIPRGSVVQLEALVFHFINQHAFLRIGNITYLLYPGNHKT